MKFNPIMTSADCADVSRPFCSRFLKINRQENHVLERIVPVLRLREWDPHVGSGAGARNDNIRGCYYIGQVGESFYSLPGGT